MIAGYLVVVKNNMTRVRIRGVSKKTKFSSKRILTNKKRSHFLYLTLLTAYKVYQFRWDVYNVQKELR